jgi:hypothetical protein
MVHPYQAGSRLWLSCLALLLLVSSAAAFTVSSTTLTPPDVVNPGDAVNITSTVYAASGTAFPSYDDLQFVTELDDPVWSYTILVNGVENVRPAERGKMLTISGFELSYENKDEVVVRVVLKARVPTTFALGSEKMFLKIQELDARSYAIPYSIVRVDHLVGQPTPTPTPAFGSIMVTSDPAGANVYLDNSIRGVTPVTLEGVSNGPHTVLLRYDGYRDYSQDVTVMAGRNTVSAVLVPRAAIGTSATSTSETVAATGSPVTVQSTPAALTGSLSITTSPPGAIVYIDGQMKGITPATIPGLSAGSHSIVLIMDGYEDFKTTTDITPGTISEFVTGLAKRKQAPGFALPIALAALGSGFILLRMRSRKE